MAKAKKVVNEMFLAASIALADYVDQKTIEAGTVYPPLEELRDVSAVVGPSLRHSDRDIRQRHALQSLSLHLSLPPAFWQV